MVSHNSIWINSIPRTGSMWTTNVVKEIFLKSNFNVYPEKNFKSDLKTIDFFVRNAIKDENKKNRYVFKNHTKIKSEIPKSKIILNIRNPYEVCASYYQFMKCKLEEAIKIASFSTQFLDFYSQKNNELLKIKFEDIESNSFEIIKKISDFCETTLDKEQIKSIDEKFKKNNVKKIILNNDEKIKKKFLKNEKISEDEVVRVTNYNIRSFDQTTGFQTGHISKKSNKDWTKVFSASDVNKIIEVLDPIVVKMGYKSQK